MSNKEVKIGMVGAGFIGQLAHLMNFVEVPGCRVVALAEFRPELRKKVARRFDIPHTYATHHALLENSDIDAVVVVTPRAHTAPTVLDCLLAGKHVLSEKPMAGTSVHAQQLIDAAHKKNLRYVVGYMKRYDEGVQLAKKVLQEALLSGELGSLLFVRAHCYMGNSYCRADGHITTDEKPDYPQEGWAMAPDWLPPDRISAYARFVNCFSHNTNLLRYLFNQTPTVAYSCVRQPLTQLAVLDFGNFQATLETGDATNRGWDEITEIFFSDGKITLKTPPALLKNVPASVEIYRAGKTQETSTPLCDWTWAFRRQAAAFIHDIREGTPSLSPGSDAIEDLRMAEAIWTPKPH